MTFCVLCVENITRIYRFRNLRRAEIRSCRWTSESSARPVPIIALSTKRRDVYFKIAAGYHSRGRKEPSRHPKGSLHCAHSSQFFFDFSRSRFCSCLHPSIFLRVAHHIHYVHCRSIPQNDVEEYLGSPDAAIERVLSAFQDALACVYATPPPHSATYDQPFFLLSLSPFLTIPAMHPFL